MAEELTFHLADFEGPLELLLTLVQKHKMDLHNIPILELIDQYTRTVAADAGADPETASAFIEMAAHLVEMKSYLLLPRSEEGERMKQELTGQLIEYDQCRRMAGALRAKGEQAPVFVRRPLEVEQDNTYDLFHLPQVLADCWQALAGRKAAVVRQPTQQHSLQVGAAGVRAGGVGEQPGGLYPAPAHRGRCPEAGAAVFPPPEPEHPCGHLSGPAGTGARRTCHPRPQGRADHAARTPAP